MLYTLNLHAVLHVNYISIQLKRKKGLILPRIFRIPLTKFNEKLSFKNLVTNEDRIRHEQKSVKKQNQPPIKSVLGFVRYRYKTSPHIVLKIKISMK